MRLQILIILLLQSLISFAQSEYFNFSKLNIQNGLSHNQVNAILKDSDGFVWIATVSGLNRFDGYSCRIFRTVHNDSTALKSNNIVSLYELPDRKMGVGTTEGLCIYNPDTERFNANGDAYLKELGLPGGWIKHIRKGGNGRYWFLYNDGKLFRYSASTKRSSAFPSSPGEPGREKIIDMGETKDGKLWILYDSKLIEAYDAGSGKLLTTSTVIQNGSSKPEDMYIDEDGDIWLWGFNTGIIFFNLATYSTRLIDKNTSPTRLNASIVNHVVQDSHGIIWIGTDHGGITLIDKKNNFKTENLVNIPDDPKSISQNSITAMYKDDRGIIWLGTYKLGVNYLNNSIVQFPYYRHQGARTTSLPYDDVNRFVEDRQGNLWIGTNGGGLIYFDRQKDTFKQYLHEPGNPNSLSNNVIVSLWMDHDNVLWIGTYVGGLNRFDGKRFTAYRHNNADTSSLSDDKVWEIFEDKDQQLWVGTLGGGLDRLDRRTGKFEHFKSEAVAPASERVSAILQDRKGNLWIGTDFGVSVHKPDGTRLRVYQYSAGKNGLSSSSIICLLEDSRENIWVGTREGLNIINSKTGGIQTFTVSEGLPDNLVLNILEDAHHSIWVSTSNGLCNIIPTQDKDSIRIAVVNYDENNNLQSREFNENAALKTAKGELVFGGPAGFNIIDPEKIGKHSYPAAITLTGFDILNKSIVPGQVVNNRVLLPEALPKLETVNLKYHENVFSIEFASLDFAASKYDKYAYRLKGFNTDWLYADGSQRRATYTNLDPGHYIFEVKALNKGGSWGPIKTLNINITPPFWRTPWAYIIYLLVSLCIFFLVRKMILDRIHMRFVLQQQRREADRIRAIDQIKTKFFTNVSHEFRTPLSLIIAPLDRIIKQTSNEEHRKQLNLVQRNAGRLLNLVNQLLDFRKIEVQEMKLHPSVGDIVRFTSDICFSFNDIAGKKNIHLSFTSDVDNLEVYFDKDKVEKILLNLISNAFKYTHENGSVTVSLQYTMQPDMEREGTIVLEVKDTGIGIPEDQHEKIFHRFFQSDVPESMVNQGTGLGLAITREFVRLHGGNITVKSEPGKGSCFTVMLPARKMLNVPAPPEADTAAVNEPEFIDKKSKKKSLLLVEDNEDLRFYLKDNLKGLYNIIEATNGLEGWEKTKSLIPDLVVSDIMMPLMDGVELAKKIRSEMTTSHIPIILLTAMGSEEKQLEALSVGVNDYVTKPFTYEILVSRMKNLLAQQKHLQKRFQHEVEVKPSEITVTSIDEQFLKQALEIAERQMDNPGFSIEDFSREMFVSRVTLYRKIMSLTGKSPSDFIRSVRLKRGAQLLQKSGMSVSEVAYQVGFNDPKVFRKFFKEEFNITPSQYAANHKSV
ncbi:hybrid sensor histidine kinase/response regulator transcription factor [Chitinophaga terrae (ex Kim and Jung 2007)]|uniref:hybrid sensor histidine kinase/response regulator transcription factor n=1 Tax=Chitinophaga terrae (ex Kim and Jung 2007) TaxID=408074 RepID=UPI0027D7E270|nr:two-component regulator propeller domain-containing protein [Chitinophaga terrae (ex Kim and Jung 2007)]